MTTTVDRHVDSIPVVNLRLLTQSELYSLSLSSSSSSSSSSSAAASHRLNGDVFIPKIDRSVFNESAGSRKQTYSRLRLAPRGSATAAKSKSSAALPRHVVSPPLDHESRQIISLLKQLFPSENYKDGDDAAVMQAAPLPPQHTLFALPPPKTESYAIAAEVPGVDSSTGKRKRGRPRRDSYVVVAKPEAAAAVTSGEVRVDNAGVPIEKCEGEAPAVGTFVLNSQGQLVQSGDVKRKRGRPRKDEVRVRKEESPIAKMEVKEEECGDPMDPLVNADIAFAEELRKRTEGLEGEEQLLGFLEGLQGEWSSGRKKRKVVQASELGDFLPEWWKILLFLKKHGGRKSLACRRFISPTGLEFVSCKEVSSYLRSYAGDGNQSNLVHNVGNIHVSNKMVLVNGMQQDTNISVEDNNNGHQLLHCSSMPMTSMNSYVKNIEAPREVMGMRKKLDPVKSGRSGTSFKIQEPAEIDGNNWHSSFSLGKENDIMEKYFSTFIDETKLTSCEEQAMKADQTICSDGLNDGLRDATSLANVPNAEIDSDSFAKLCERRFDDIDLSGNNKALCFGGDHAMPDVDSKKISVQVPSTGNLIVLPMDGQSCIDNATNPCCRIDEQEKSLASNASNSFVNRQTPDSLNGGCVDTAERHEVQHAKNYDYSELSDNFRSGMETAFYINQERSSTRCSFVSNANEHPSVSENSFVCNSILEEIQPGRVTCETGLVCPSGYQQGYNQNNQSNTISMRQIFGSSGEEANAISGTMTGINAQTPPTVLSGDNQLFGTESGILSSSVSNNRLISVPVNRLPCPNSGEKAPDFRSNPNRVYGSTLMEKSKSRSAEHSSDNEYINVFLNESQLTDDSISELLWRNVDQNVQQGGLANNSSALMQSSASYLNFDVPSGKVENGDLSTSEHFDNTHCSEGLKSSRLEQFEPEILTAQATSQSKEANVMSYDGSTEKGFNPSGWADKVAASSIPDIESRRKMGTCVWCRDVLYHDAYGAGMQSGSVGIMCANCQGKFSGDVNFL